MNEAIDLLLSLIQQAESLVDELTTDEAIQVMQIFQDAVTILQQQAVPVEPVPKIPSGEFPSSNVNGFKYNPKNKKLWIQFHGPYPEAEGPVYQYDSVPPYIFEILERGAIGPKSSGANSYHRWIRGVTPSYGAVVNALIKAGGFQYRRVA